jgi:gamma-glutamyltranspeptidase/glutathione hydrolase
VNRQIPLYCRQAFTAGRILFGLLAILLLPLPVAATTAPPQHPPAAAIASAHPLATRAGQEILAAGGNAFDAAVAVSAALAVVEPMSSGLGGGGFWLLHRQSDGFETMIDGREQAPGAATRDMYLDDNGAVIPRLSLDGPLAAGIPGEVAALDHLARHYGRLPLARSLAPAIKLARDGFQVDNRYRMLARWRLQTLRRSPAATAIFLDNGDLPPQDFILRQPDLAATLQAIADDGAAGFYQGQIARHLVDGVRAAGGIWTLQDLADYKVVERTPIRGHYQGLTITSAAPPSSGGIALVTMLNILSSYDLGAIERHDGSAGRKHVIVEAMRRAYRDRADYLGDPDFVSIPVARLTDPDYGAGLAASIRLDKATPSALLPGGHDDSGGNDTTHFSIIDGDGNRVAATLSVNYPFGSGFVAPGTGVVLNDEMDDFSSKPGVPNAYGLVGDSANSIAPGKRPLSSMSPTFVEDNNRVAILGTPGGSRIISMVLLGILDIAAGNGPQSWVSLPRFHHQFLPDRINYEQDALTTQEIEALRQRGHHFKASGRKYGNMQAVLWDRRQNRVSAASDPRGNGLAEVMPDQAPSTLPDGR